MKKKYPLQCHEHYTWCEDLVRDGIDCSCDRCALHRAREERDEATRELGKALAEVDRLKGVIYALRWTGATPGDA